MSVTGRYELKQKLGEGGMGEVHLAYDNVMKRECAIKFPATPGGISDENKKRFMREILILSGVSHPSIVNFFESGEIDGSLYYTMEYIDGKSINDSKLKPEKIVEYLIQISSALDELHKYGVVHRDIKPENILISNGKAILVDFGIAFQTDSARLTQTGGLIGTTFYLSPEQIKGRKIDARLDIYSLGIVLYELLTGSHPFVGEDIFALSYKITEEYPKHPRELNPNIPEELEKICLKCLQKSPSRRYNNAKELMEAFENYQNGIRSEEENLIESSTEIMPLVGREKIIDKMHKLLDKTMSGGSHSLQLVGSLGLGKSRLLDELKFMALAKKIKYFSCNPEFVVDGNPAISNLFSELALQDIALDLEDVSVYGGLIREFSPRLADKLNIPEGAVSRTGVIKIEMTTDLILKLLGDHAVVFAFEDKLDKLTLSVMKKLIKRKQPGKLVVNVSVSGDEEDTFEKIVTLSPLTKYQIAQLVHKVLGHHISSDDLNVFFRRTAGNPVLAFELLMLSKKSGEDITTTLLPENIADILATKIRNLPKSIWEMLIKISMISNHLTVKDIGAITGYENDLLYSSVTRLVDDGLVREKDVGDEIQFVVSGVIADNVMIETGSEIRQQLSLELAQILETIDTDKYCFEIGKYYVLGNMFERGVSYLVDNTLTTNRSVFLDHKLYAVMLFKDRIDEIQDINVKALAYICLSWYYKQKDDIAQSEQNLELARDIEENNDIDIPIRRKILVARFKTIRRRFEDKRTLGISKKLLELTNAEAPLSSQHVAYISRGIALLTNNYPSEALQWNLKALEVAERINDPVSLCSSMTVISINYIELKDYDRAAECLKKLKKYAEDNYNVFYVSAAMSNLAQLYIKTKHIQKAKNQLEEVVNYSSKHSVYHVLSKSSLLLARVNLCLLELDDAREAMKICDELCKKGRIKTIEVVEDLNSFLVYMAILDEDKRTFEKCTRQLSDSKISITEYELSVIKFIYRAERALSEMNFEEVIKMCKKIGLSHKKQNDPMQYASYQILHLLWESFALSYLKKHQHADRMLKQATEILISANDPISDDIWVSKVINIVGLAVEISSVKKAYSSSSRIASKIKKEGTATELFTKLCEAGANGGNWDWDYTYFYFWPRLTWMIGDFALWLADIDDSHPRLNIMMKEATSIIVNTVDYLKKNNLKAYIKELEKQRRQFAWKLKK